MQEIYILKAVTMFGFVVVVAVQRICLYGTFEFVKQGIDCWNFILIAVFVYLKNIMELWSKWRRLKHEIFLNFYFLWYVYKTEYYQILQSIWHGKFYVYK